MKSSIRPSSKDNCWADCSIIVFCKVWSASTHKEKSKDLIWFKCSCPNQRETTTIIKNSQTKLFSPKNSTWPKTHNITLFIVNFEFSCFRGIKSDPYHYVNVAFCGLITTFPPECNIITINQLVLNFHKRKHHLLLSMLLSCHNVSRTKNNYTTKATCK